MKNKLLNSGSSIGVSIASVAVFGISTLGSHLVFAQTSKISPRSTAESLSSHPLDTSSAKKLLEEPRFAEPENWHWGHFKNADAALIRYGFAKSPLEKSKGTVVILPGFTEFAQVYFETAREFLARGYNVYSLDWRGAGGSDRYSSDRERYTSLGLEHDESDLDQFLTAIVKRHSTAPIILIAHSLGGHIALRYLHDHQDIVTKAVLSAPALDCPGTEAPPWMVNLFSWLKWRSGHGDEYVDKQGDWKYMAPKISRMVTHSHDPVRVKLEEAWSVVIPELRSGGATWKWLWEFQRSCDTLRQKGYAEAIKIPTLIGCATADRIANSQHDEAFAKSMPLGKAYMVQDARHELLLEDDAHRSGFMKAIFDFLEK